jgi:hypothetical protein
MQPSKGIGFWVVLGIACLFLISPEASGQALYKSLSPGKPLASGSFNSGGITWTPRIVYESVVLRVTGQGGMVFEEKFGVGTVPFIGLLDQDGKPLQDGQYGYELRFTPVIPSDVKRQMAALKESEDRSDYVAELQNLGVLPKEPLVQSGTFRVSEGKVILPDRVENEPGAAGAVKGSTKSRGSGAAPLDQFINDDQIVVGSICAGFDCVNNEVFGLENLKLKQNNNRILFDDTSVSAGFPANDWQIKVNDDNSGGASYFAVEDITGAKTPFKIEAGAQTNALYVRNNGRIGVGTSMPAVLIHTVWGDSPTLRLDQDASSGWTPQVWDVAGNESNFFVRDVTNGSKLPFRIQFGAPNNTLTLKADGKVGIGTYSPSSILHVEGDAYIKNGLIIGSSREYKDNIRDLTRGEAIDTLAALNPVKYNYKTDKDEEHLGFIAEDVPDLVATKDRKGLSPMDIVAVLTKVVQEKSRLAERQQNTIERLERALEAMEKRLSSLEKQ